MKTISSRQNDWFKRLRDAMREHATEIVIEGPKQVSDAIAGGWKAIAIITRGGEDDDAQAAVRTAQSGAGGAVPSRGGEAAQHGAAPRGSTAAPQQLHFASALFDSIAETRTTQGVMALFERPRHSLASIVLRRDTIIVALDGVQDPGNVGTIVRLAAAFDAAGVVLLPGCADAFSPKAIRASAGAILSVPVAPVTAQELIAAHIPLFAAMQTSARAPVPAKNAVLVFGSEGSGVSPEIAQSAKGIAVPMSSRVESLNVAAAAAILLSRSFEARSR